MKNISKLLAILFIIALALSCTKKSEKVESAALPFSTKVVRGTLNNGMQYFIRKNDLPSDRIELRLSVRSGSLNEADSERGIAHFVEHLAFNGTEHFKGNDFVKFFEEMGMSFGNDLNAYTSADETNYQLTVPTDKVELLEKSFLMMRDWAHAITFEEKEVIKERGVILSEWRQRNTARKRIFNEARKELYADSMYVYRDPIGDVKILENATKPLVEGYYKKWYQPENMAIIVVGNIEEDRALELIKKNFADLSSKKVPTPASRKINVPHGVRVKIVSDAEATSSSASLLFYFDDSIAKNLADYKKDKLFENSLALFSRRAELLVNEKQLDIISLFAGSDMVGSNKSVAFFDFDFDPNKFMPSLKTVLKEVERAVRYGFSENELNYLKKASLASLEAMTKEDYKVESARFAERLSSHFIYEAPFMEAVQRKALLEEFYASTSLADFNQAFKSVLGIEDMLLLITVPENDLDKIKLDKDTFIKVLAEVKSEEVEMRKEEAFKKSLIDPNEVINGGKVAFVEEHKTTHDKIITLENGARMLLRKNGEEKLKFSLSAKKVGGTNILKDKDALLLPLALRVLANSGFKGISKRNLDNLLADKIVSVQPTVTESTFGFILSGLFSDMESSFELLYKFLKEANIDAAVLDAHIASSKVMLLQEANKKELQFNRKVRKSMYNENYRRNYLETSDLDNLSKEELLKLYSDNYLDISNYIFVLSGDFDENRAIDLFSKYVGAFPKSTNTNKTKDLGVLIEKSGTITEKGEIEDKATLNIYFTKRAAAKPFDKYKSYILQHILDTRYREEIREELGGAYSVGCVVKYSNVHNSNLGEVFGRIVFPMDPKRETLLVEKSKEILARIIATGVKESEVETAKRIIATSLKANYKNNLILSEAISQSLLFNEPIYTAESVAKVVEEISLNDINDFIKSYLKEAPTFISLFEPAKR